VSVAPSPTGDQLEQQTNELLEYAREIGLPNPSKPAARSLIVRLGDVKLAKRRLRERRERIGREIERQVDDAWLDTRAALARDEHADQAADRAAERTTRRAGLPIMLRLANALRESTTLPALSTPDFVASSSAGGEPGVLPPGGSLDIAEHYWHLLSMLTKSLEREVDRARYGSQPETREQRAARIVSDYQGLAPHVVAAIDRTAGSPDTVERDRHFMGVRKNNGLPLPAERTVLPDDVFVRDSDGAVIARTRAA
jgi:hypothetical protein